MTKLRIFIVGLFAVFVTINSSNAQWITSGNNIWNSNTGGNVGIGTISPTEKLQIGDMNDSKDSKIVIPGVYNFEQVKLGQYGNGAGGLEFINHSSGTTSYGVKFITNIDNGISGLQIQTANLSSTYDNLSYSTKLAILTNGNVGIGTINPKAKLDVGAFIENGQTGTVFGRLSEGNTTGDGTYLGIKGYETQFNGYGGKSFSIEHHFYGQTNSSINFFRGGSATGGFITFNTSDNSEKMRIDPYGRVGIGTTAPDEALTVKGKIHTNEVIIDMKDPIADYVFHPSYNLMPLHEVEQYVKTNSHLPEISSASEVSKNGMSMGEMQNKLLQKIEELTLYVIDLQKANEKQNIEIDQLKRKNK